MTTVQVSQVEVRPVRLEDMESVYKLEDACFKDPYPSYFLDQLAEANPLSFLVATIEGDVVGYAVVDRWRDHNHLVSIAVHPDARRQGIGRRLLAALKAELEVDKPLRLEVRKSNTAAIGLYLSNGFRRIGMVEGYYADGEDAILMEK